MFKKFFKEKKVDKYNNGCKYPSRATKYLTDLIYFEFDNLKYDLHDHLEGEDYHSFWYALVAFILFVIHIEHKKTDKEGQKILNLAILDYISNHKNPQSYLNYFNDEEEANKLGLNKNIKNFVYNYKPKELTGKVQNLYETFLKAWNKADSTTLAMHGVSYGLGVYMRKLSRSKNDNLINFNSSVFKLLSNKFTIDGANNTYKLFNCNFESIQNKKDIVNCPKCAKSYFIPKMNSGKTLSIKCKNCTETFLHETS